MVTGSAMVLPLPLPLPLPLHLPRLLSGSSPVRARFVAPFVGPSSLGSFFVSLGQITKRSKNKISSNADDSDGKIQDEEQAEQDAAREGERVREDVFKSHLVLAAGKSTDLMVVWYLQNTSINKPKSQYTKKVKVKLVLI